MNACNQNPHEFDYRGQSGRGATFFGETLSGLLAPTVLMKHNQLNPALLQFLQN